MEYVHGGDIYTYEGMTDHSANINPLGPGPTVMKAASDSLEQISRYPDSRCRSLRHALAEQLALPEEYFVFGNGAADILFSLVLAEKPRKALILAPTFAEYEQALRSVDCEVRYYLRKEEHAFTLNEEYLGCLTEEIDMIFLCSPDNPTGGIIGRELLCRILNRCRENKIRMVLDECFYEFLAEPEKATMQDYIINDDELFILRAFTKMHAMPGLRLGYGISKDIALLERIVAVRQPWSVSVTAQAAGLAAVSEKEWVSRTREFITEERLRVERALAKIGIRYIPSEVNYILLKSHYDLFTELKKRNILVRDCSNYRGLEKGYYRIAIRTGEENEKLIKALRDIYERNGGENG